MTETHPLHLQAVTKHYPEFDLGPIDLAVPRGYVTGLVGANGAGKTTAIKIALGAARPGAGRVTLLDKTRVGVVLDQPCWDSNWRVRDVARLLSPLLSRLAAGRVRRVGLLGRRHTPHQSEGLLPRHGHEDAACRRPGAGCAAAG